ncbi:hypothetical protein Dda_1943 [Drechslerella dactyloides]|uniref:Uncharacterized protein n=1 Tax=Drechslerella dactyloides TaxID=74499 RepID=A0AAD6NMK8_DREDA|nr:hypothetical protein Dda_1943 [Drechslerella dactyloides]
MDRLGDGDGGWPVCLSLAWIVDVSALRKAAEQGSHYSRAKKKQQKKKGASLVEGKTSDWLD